MRPRLMRRSVGAVIFGIALHVSVSGAADPVGQCPPSETFCAEPVPARPAGFTDDSLSPPESRVLDVFVRSGCPHCAEAKRWLEELKRTRPALDIRIHAVDSDPDAAARFSAAVAGLPVAGVPTFASGGRVVVGFDPDRTPGAILALLDGRDPGRTLSLPLIGEVDPSRLGLPAFTILLGLIDGFNPCAMWVLLFLLSMLLHMKDRARMLAVAGTFVAVSGLVYFAFMAAWLNVFLIVGLTRSVQVVLGLVALAVGAIHVKDFFALHEGISLSIPESAKPGIIERIRRILRAEKLPAALAGAVVLAVLVNMLELLCTAGIPAVYTQVLAAHALPAWHRYALLALYNGAYMLDDGVMVFLAVVTMSQRKLQESGGRQLKLVSGIVIAVLGVLLLAKPEWLAW